MIESRGEYETLIESDLVIDQNRAVRDSALLDLWLEIVSDLPQYRHFVARNKTIPREVLRVLVEDDDREVRLTLAMRRAVGEDDELAGVLASDLDPAIRAALAKNPKLSPHLLVLLTQDDDEWVRDCASQTLAQRQTHPCSDSDGIAST